MASKDKDVVSLPGSPWSTIIEAAKEELSSLDSDYSPSDFEEEEPFIFQRNQPVLIPDLTEELAEDPAGGEDPAGAEDFGPWIPVVWSSPPEPLLVPGGPATEPRSGQKAAPRGSALQEGRGPDWACQSSAKSSPLPKREEATLALGGELETKPSDAGLRDPAERRALRRERRKVIETGLLQKVTLRGPGPACGGRSQAAEPASQASSEHVAEGRPVLSLRELEHWDLDYILQSLPGGQANHGEETPRTAWWLADRCQGQDRTMQRSQDELLEQLALLCTSQPRACASAQKVPAEKPQEAEKWEAGSRCAVAEPGFQDEPGQKPAASQRLRMEPPTIFIDLRQTEPPEPRDHPSPESSEHSSSDSEEEEEEAAALRGQQGPARAASSSRRLR